MINSIKSFQAVILQTGGGKNIVPQSNFRQLPEMGLTVLLHLGEDICSVIGVFWITRRQTGKIGRFGYKQKSKNGYDIRTIQDLLGHKNVKTNMIYPKGIPYGTLTY